MYEEDVEDIEIENIPSHFTIDSEDAKALSLFMPNGNQSQNIGDLIYSKIMQHEKNKEKRNKNDSEVNEKIYDSVKTRLNPKVKEAYTLIAKLLKNYTSGRLPKAFNIIPSLKNWEEILYLTKPTEWSPQALRAATRVFASNMNHHLAQKFYGFVLFPRIREDLSQHKKLNYHLYMALKKTFFKPDAFYKGILLPLCEEGDCTMHEATILGSLLKKVSIPAAHSSVALYKISQLAYSGTNSLFIGVLLNKKYALPYEVLDSLVEHFLRVKELKEVLPVLWQQSFLVFVQRYKNELTQEQKDQLKALTKIHPHHDISPEIRRELLSSKCRYDEDELNTMKMN